MFNTLKYAKMLEEVGFSREQSEISVKILVEIMEEKLASKQDLQNLKLEITHSLTVRMGTMFIAFATVLIAVLKLN
jgi:hypothetical protein